MAQGWDTRTDLRPQVALRPLRANVFKVKFLVLLICPKGWFETPHIMGLEFEKTAYGIYGHGIGDIDI